MTEEIGVPCEIYTRVVGFYRPVSTFNKGKTEEFRERVEFNLNKSLTNYKE